MIVVQAADVDGGRREAEAGLDGRDCVVAAAGRVEEAEVAVVVCGGGGRIVSAQRDGHARDAAVARVEDAARDGVAADFGDEGIAASTASGLERVGCHRKVARVGESGDVGVASRVHGDAQAIVLSAPAPAEVGRVEQGRAARVQLRHVGIGLTAAILALNGIDNREVGRGGESGDVSVARRIHRDAVAIVALASAPAQISRVEQGRAAGVQFRHIRIGYTAGFLILDGIGRREVGREGESRDVGVAG